MSKYLRRTAHYNQVACNMHAKSIKNILIAGVAAALLVSCSGLHFNEASFEPGLKQIGQQQAQYDCRKYGLSNDYQKCLDEVNHNYNDGY